MAELRPGARFAGYRIVRRLGWGGMGVVYEAVEVSLDRRVALKLIAPDVARDPGFRERFAIESRIAARVEHPNLVPIYAVGEEYEMPFMAMRLIWGSSLAAKLEQLHHLEPADAAALVAKVAAGLDAIHAAGLVHRDVKPGNILLSESNGPEEVYLTDFGLAKHLAQTSELTQGGQLLGTLDYVSPEQVRGDAVEARTDVYALGCVLYKLLTGEPPFPGGDGVAKLWAHVNAPPPLPSKTPGVPRAFDPVIARALAKTPAARYPSAGDLGRAAQAAAGGVPVTEPERDLSLAAVDAEDEEATTRLPPSGLRSPPASPRDRAAWRRVAPLLATMLVAVGAFVVVRVTDDDSRSAAAEKLIERADQICAQSRRRYVRIAATRPTEPDEARAQAEGLVRVTADSLERLRALRPPAEIADEYRTYLAQRQLMLFQLREAREAINRSDLAAFRAAFARIEAQQPLRYDSARALGLEQCSRGR